MNLEVVIIFKEQIPKLYVLAANLSTLGGRGRWVGVGGRGNKGSLLCDTSAKKLQNLRPEATKVTILRLRHHHDGQVDIYIDPTLRISDTFFESAVVVHFLPGFL